MERGDRARGRHRAVAVGDQAGARRLRRAAARFDDAQSMGALAIALRTRRYRALLRAARRSPASVHAAVAHATCSTEFGFDPVSVRTAASGVRRLRRLLKAGTRRPLARPALDSESKSGRVAGSFLTQSGARGVREWRPGVSFDVRRVASDPRARRSKDRLAVPRAGEVGSSMAARSSDRAAQPSGVVIVEVEAAERQPALGVFGLQPDRLDEFGSCRGVVANSLIESRRTRTNSGSSASGSAPAASRASANAELRWPLTTAFSADASESADESGCQISHASSSETRRERQSGDPGRHPRTRQQRGAARGDPDSPGSRAARAPTASPRIRARGS